MTYTAKHLADLAGVSVRTLHWYDELGLLKPARDEKNGYRTYGEKDLLVLQQILFFRELEIPLKDIARIVADPGFDMAAALKDHRRVLMAKHGRLDSLIATLTKTVRHMEQDERMTDEELYEGFSKEEIEEMKREAKARWGNTDAYRQSQERTAKMTKADWQAIKEESSRIIVAVAGLMDRPVGDPDVQEQIALYHKHMNRFYDCSAEMFRGLGEMYVADPRFTATYEKVAPGLAVYMRDAIAAYADAQIKNGR